MTKSVRGIVKEFKHILAQNKEKYGGYTVFHFKFNGVLVRMMALADVKAIRTKALADQQAGFREMVEKSLPKELKEGYATAMGAIDTNIYYNRAINDCKKSLDQLLTKLGKEE